jgi:hypothetical protein
LSADELYGLIQILLTLAAFITMILAFLELGYEGGGS